MRALAVVALLFVAVAGAYIVKSGLDREERTGPGPQGPAASARALLDDLMERRAQALESGDAAAYAATATGRQARVDRRAALRARRVGLAEVTLAIREAIVKGGSARLRVEQGYRIRGIAGRFASRRTLRAVRLGDGWRVLRVRGVRRRAPWEVAGQQRTLSPHFVVLAPAALDVRAGGLLDALEAGYGRIRELIRRGRLRRRYLVQVAADAAQARALTETIRGIDGLAALTDSEIRQDGPADRVTEVLSQRLLVPWPSFVALGPDERVTVVAHELAHAAVAGATSGRTPAWLVEGLALYVSDDRRVEEAARLVAAGMAARSARRALTLTGLTHPDAIARLDGEAQGAAYAYSSAASHYVAERYGPRALLDLYDAFNHEDLEGEAGDVALTDAATRRVLRRPLRRLESDLREWILSQGLFAY